MDELGTSGRASTGSTAKGTTVKEDVQEGESARGRAGDEEADGVGTGEAREVAGKKRRWHPGRRQSKSYSHLHFRVYKRRWFGLAQLVLLNIVVSWDVSVFGLSLPWF
jgi:FLVCR family MFS transporter 7